MEEARQVNQIDKDTVSKVESHFEEQIKGISKQLESDISELKRLFGLASINLVDFEKNFKKKMLPRHNIPHIKSLCQHILSGNEVAP